MNEIVFKIRPNLLIIILNLFLISSLVRGQDCLNNSGTIKGIGNYIGKSTRIDLKDTIFMCYNDRLYLQHNKDYNLTDDPNSETKPGIGYVWYNSMPKISGEKISDVKKDSVVWLPHGENINISVGSLNGDIVFSNILNTNSTLFGLYVNPIELPSLVYYAPITIDRRKGKNGYHESDESCVDVNIDETIAIVYLNAISINDLTYFVDGDSTKVSFTISGGAPEYYKTFKGKRVEYTDIVINRNNKNIVLITKGVSHGEKVVFKVDKFGLYDIFINDNVSCSFYESINLTMQPQTTLSLDSICGSKGEKVCLSFSVEQCRNLEYLIGKISYDSSVLKFDKIEKSTNGPVVSVNIIEKGLLTINLLTNSMTFIEKEELFKVCFTIIGDIRKESIVELSKFMMVDNENDFSPLSINGVICNLNESDLFVSAKHCGSNIDKDDGYLSFKIYGGKDPFKYSVKDSNGKLIEDGNIDKSDLEILVMDLFPDNYYIDVIDSNNDTFSMQYGISTILPYSFDSINIQDPSCFDEFNGYIWLPTISDSSNLNILWSNGIINKNAISSLRKGIYGVSVTNETGCVVDTLIQLNADRIELEVLEHDDVSCNNLCDGEIKVKVNNPINDFTYFWSNGVEEAINSNLCAGKYNLKVETTNNCSFDKSFVINEPEKIIVSLNEKQNIYSDFYFPGFIHINVNMENYSFEWSGPNNFHSNNKNLDSLLIPGCYTVTVKDSISECTVEKTICISKVSQLLNEFYKPEVVIFPNPTTREFLVEYKNNNSLIHKLFLHDITGVSHKMNFEKYSENIIKVNVLDLISGFYIVEVVLDDNRSIFQKLYIK